MLGEITLSVAELNEYVRKQLAADPLLRRVRVTGEISGYKHHVSGHRYFSLKDESARVQCVMFRQQAMSLGFTPTDGMRVTIVAAASVYVRDGSYQLYVDSMTKQGEGELFVRFEKLKQKLSKEGLFDPARKRPIPLYPKTIGVATSETGAALRDIIRVAKYRDPSIGIVIAPCAVQGAGSAAEIVSAIESLNRNAEADVILVGRGGGSIEDLWSFNEEAVAYAIAASEIPVISCVGHETDFTIADFVADMRAATPSNAAELAVPVRADTENAVRQLTARLNKALMSGQELRHARLQRLFASPVFSMPAQLLLDRRVAELDMLETRALTAYNKRMEAEKNRLKLLDRSLKALDPGKVIERGYSIVKRRGSYITAANMLSRGDIIDIMLSGGEVEAEVK